MEEKGEMELSGAGINRPWGGDQEDWRGPGLVGGGLGPAPPGAQRDLRLVVYCNLAQGL